MQEEHISDDVASGVGLGLSPHNGPKTAEANPENWWQPSTQAQHRHCAGQMLQRTHFMLTSLSIRARSGVR